MAFESTDVRSRFPRFTPEIMQATPAQIALAWLLAQQPWIVPIPGTRKLHRLQENLGAAAIDLNADDVREINDAAARIEIHGPRGTGHEQYR